MKNKLFISKGNSGIKSIAASLLLAFIVSFGAANALAQKNGGVKTDNKISYHNGPVMTGTSNVYFIWYGQWSGYGEAEQILADFIIYLGRTPYFRINTTYPDSTGDAPGGGLNLGGIITDFYSHGQTLSDADVADIIYDAIVNFRLPTDTEGVYIVIGSADVNAPGLSQGSCQYHAKDYSLGVPLKYAFIGNPEQSPAVCAPQFVAPSGARLPTPNGNFTADALANLTAHVLNGTITNPIGSGWYDRNGLENSDKCAALFGPTFTTANGAQANITIGYRNYLIQQNWVNARRGYCSLAYP